MDFASIFSSLGGTAFTVVFFVLALSIIVAVHEYGHYIVGRWSGIHADVFSLGFGKPLVQRTDKRGTVWQIAAIPLGGYVKFAGDANAASAPNAHAVDALPEEQRRHTMPGAPLWARTVTVAAGPMFNFIFSALVFAGFVLLNGQMGDRLIVDEVHAMPTEVALQTGDVILAIDGTPVPDLDEFGPFLQDLPPVASMTYSVLREGAEIEVEAPHPLPVIVGGISPKSAAGDAGLKVGDVVTHADTLKLNSFYQLQDIVAAAAGQPVTLTIWRDGESFDTTLKARSRDLPVADGGFETRWLIGITGSNLFTVGTEPVGVFEALKIGTTNVWELIKLNLSGLYHMITGSISTCNLTGPVGIANTVSTMASQGTASFISTVALISTAIGLINLFPIPVLDGGHLVFYAYEAVRGKPLPERAVGIMMTIGLVVIVTLMFLGLGADFFCI
ncbi:RIP metalloprotease RseP [Celeribacter arenosi]|uniref:Zinc metalloprotease n=1 Tax=Celeribacter arenosi TaxID=792649 RepID=A0ABP7KG14_9RHOB